jgi:hypothetical protein
VNTVHPAIWEARRTKSILEDEYATSSNRDVVAEYGKATGTKLRFGGSVLVVPQCP